MCFCIILNTMQAKKKKEIVHGTILPSNLQVTSGLKE